MRVFGVAVLRMPFHQDDLGQFIQQRYTLAVEPNNAASSSPLSQYLISLKVRRVTLFPRVLEVYYYSTGNVAKESINIFYGFNTARSCSYSEYGGLPVFNQCKILSHRVTQRHVGSSNFSLGTRTADQRLNLVMSGLKHEISLLSQPNIIDHWSSPVRKGVMCSDVCICLAMSTL